MNKFYLSKSLYTRIHYLSIKEHNSLMPEQYQKQIVSLIRNNNLYQNWATSKYFFMFLKRWGIIFELKGIIFRAAV